MAELVDSPFLIIANIPGQQSGYRRSTSASSDCRFTSTGRESSEVGVLSWESNRDIARVLSKSSRDIRDGRVGSQVPLRRAVEDTTSALRRKFGLRAQEKIVLSRELQLHPELSS